jgi:hypothetical protein
MLPDEAGPRSGPFMTAAPPFLCEAVAGVNFGAMPPDGVARRRAALGAGPYGEPPSAGTPAVLAVPGVLAVEQPLGGRRVVGGQHDQARLLVF